MLALSAAASGIVDHAVPRLAAVLAATTMYFVADYAVISIRIGHHRVGFGFGEAAVILGLALVSPAYLIIIGGIAAGSASAYARRGSTKTFFNVCNTVTGVGLAAGTAHVFGLGTPSAYVTPFSTGWLSWLSVGDLGALLIGAIVFVCWTTMTTSGAVAASQNIAFGPVWRRALPINLLTGLGNVAIAFSVLALARYSPITLATLPPTLFCVHAAYRGYVRAREEREAWQQLDAATRDLSRLDESAALAAAVVRAAQLFRAEYAEIALFADPRSGAPARWMRGDAHGVRDQGEQFPEPVTAGVTAPLRTPGQLLGELRLAFGGTVSLSTREDQVLSTFAYSVSSTLLSARLFEQTRAEAERSAYEASHDDLTGLANRNLLQQRTAAALAATSNGDVCAVLLLDIVHFREVNETLGHDAGDVLLREIASRLTAVARRSDTVARIGGNEFALLLTELREPASADAVAAGVLRALTAPVTLEGLALSVEASLGVACSPQDATTAPQLLRCAEVAAHQAKTDPGSIQRYRSDRDASSVDRLALVGELRTAIDDRQLVLHFQPKIDLTVGAVVGAEALVRWQHPRRGMLGPIDFVPAAESSGLIGVFTDHVLELAVAECASWSATADGPSVAVNLSSRNLLDAGLPDRVAAVLRRYGLPPARLILEITETIMMSELEVVDEVLAALVKLGVQMSVDDFGTGYSSLTFLSRVSVHEVKIDRGFVASMLVSPGDAAIVRATIDLAHSFDLRVVAEGVEEAAQQRSLTELGCDLAQGYHLGRPAPAPAFRAVLAASPPPSSIRHGVFGTVIPLPSTGR